MAEWIEDRNRYNEDTLFKVQRALHDVCGLSAVEVTDAIIEMQNAGILFRERAAQDPCCFPGCHQEWNPHPIPCPDCSTAAGARTPGLASTPIHQATPEEPFGASCPGCDAELTGEEEYCRKCQEVCEHCNGFREVKGGAECCDCDEFFADTTPEEPLGRAGAHDFVRKESGDRRRCERCGGVEGHPMHSGEVTDERG